MTDKLGELAKYVCLLLENDSHFSQEKLYTALFMCDVGAYKWFGKPITGQCYIKTPNGPAFCSDDATQILMDKWVTFEASSSSHIIGEQRYRAIIHEPCHLDVFSPHEVSLIDRTVFGLKFKSMREINIMLDEMAGWNVAAFYEAIPYESALVDHIPLQDEDIHYGRSLADKMRLALAPVQIKVLHTEGQMIPCPCQVI